MFVSLSRRPNDANGKRIWLTLCLFYFLGHLPQSCLPQSKFRDRGNSGGGEEVETAYGSLRGLIISKSGSMPRDVKAYLGVPYASAPAASLRFMPPLTPSHSSEPRIAHSFGPVCPQVLPDITNRTKALSKIPLLKYTRLLEVLHLLSNQSEDCLYLNVYVPISEEKRSKISEGGHLAIVVVLHGDSWEWGSGSLVDGSALASIGNVIVITLNYRLGILGFLQTSSQQGNFALMDIVAALNWIRENGRAFGGDPNKVTLLGHRTGAVLANFLMLAPVASELFHRVILLSGSSLSPWSFQRHAKGNVRKIAQHFNCISESGGSSFGSMGGGGGGGSSRVHELRDLGPCLRDVPLSDLLRALNTQLLHPRFISRLGPLIDSTVVKSDFVSEMKYDPNGVFSKFQLLVGSASIESFDELNTEDIEDGLPDIKRDRILRTLVRNIYLFHLNEIYSTVKNEYTDWEKPRKDFIDVRDSVLNILSDGLTLAPLIQVASMHSSKGNAKTYFLHFQYEPDHSVYPHRIGSISEDLLQFSMGIPVLPSKRGEISVPSYTGSDAKASSTLMRYLSNFIISGDPNCGYDTQSPAEESQLPYWESYDPVTQLYLEFGNGDPHTRTHYRGHKMALWLNLIPQLHQSGGSDVSMLHHNFKEEKPEYYEGSIREQSKHAPTTQPSLFPPKARTKGISKESISSGILTNERENESEGDYEGGGGESDYKIPASTPTLLPPILTSSECPPNTTINGTVVINGGDGDTEIVRQLAASHHHSYGTALGVTIGVGCCLLLLNLLIFLAIYHQKNQSVPVVPKPHPDEQDDQLSLRNNSLCRHQHHQYHHHIRSGNTGYSYGEPGRITPDYEEDLIQELRHSTHSSASYIPKENTTVSGFCSPTIPEPPPPPRSSIPPSLAGSMVSLASSVSASGGIGSGGILRRPPQPPERDNISTGGGSMKKRVQIQEISV